MDPLIKSQGFFESNQQLSLPKSVKPATKDQWVSRILSNLARPGPAVAFAILTTFITVVGPFAISSPARAADLMLEFRNGRWHRISPDELDREVEREEEALRERLRAERHFNGVRRPEPKAVEKATPRKPTNPSAAARQSVGPAPPMPAHQIAKPPAAPRAKSAAASALASAPPLRREKRLRPLRPAYVPANAPKASVAAFEPPPARRTQTPAYPILIAAWRTIQVFFWALVGLVVLGNSRHIARFIDSLFETEPPEAPTTPTGDLQTEAVAASLVLDLRDLAQSEISQAELRKETDLLRALKEKLDAEAESARATIRRERTQAQQQDLGKDNP